MLKAYLNILFLVCISSLLQGQELRFEQLPTEIGWTSNTTNDILQDHRGYLWIATWSGLMRYDGYGVKIYRQEPGSTNKLKSNKITCLFEDSQQRLWVGTHYTGFYLYDREKDGFIQYCKLPHDMNSLSHNNVWSITEDRLGFLWVGTEKGLNRFEPESGQFVHYENSETDTRSLSQNIVWSLAEAPDGSFWVGAETGLNRLIRGKEGQKDYFARYSLAPEGVSEDDFLRHNFIKCIIPSQTEANTLWIGTSIGMKKVRYHLTELEDLSYETFYHNFEQTGGLSHRFISDILEDPETQKLWIATYKGLNILDLKQGTFSYYFADGNQPNRLKNNVIKSLYKDKFNVLWIGTDKGVSHVNLNAKPFRNIRLKDGLDINNNIIASMCKASDGQGLWIGTNGGGLNYLSTEKGQQEVPDTRYYPLVPKQVTDLANFVSDMLVDHQGQLWLATQGAGLLIIPEENIPGQGTRLRALTQYTKENLLADDYIMCLRETAGREIWIGYWDKGLSRYNPLTKSFQHFDQTSNFEANLAAFPIVCMAESQEKGREILWLGTRGGGLYKLEVDSFQLHLKRQYAFSDSSHSLSNNFINSLYFNHEGKLWIGTESGLNILDVDSHHFTHITEKDGLSSNMIQAILEDSAMNMWVSSQRGISYLQLNEGQFEVKNFDTSNGLQDNLFYANSAAISPQGELVFGGVNGLNMFQPTLVGIDSTAPLVSISDFRMANESVAIGELSDGRSILKKSISETDHISLNYSDHVISFEFVGLHFGEPNKIQYAYQLTGFNKDWVYTDASNRIATYTNLPYEDFTFRVKAANGDGIWSEETELKLSVKPPFWLTPWAYAIYGLLFLGSLYGVRLVTKMRADFRHSLALEVIEREKLQEVNRIKLQFFTNISHELRTPLTLIISPLEQFIKEQTSDRKLHKSFLRMHKNANRLLNMINQLLDIRKSEAGLMKLKVAEGNIVKFIHEVVLSFSSLAKQKNITFSFAPETDQIPLWYDRDQLEKVLFNLLSNAFKFTPEGGEVRLQLAVGGGQDEVGSMQSKGNGLPTANYILLTVIDTGHGIPDRELPYIFDRFYQVESSQDSREQLGTGIGLALTKSIVEAHHGRIWVESQEQKGSTFFVQLPLGDAHFTTEQKINAFQDSENISNYLALQEESEEPIVIVHTHGKKEPLPQLLIVEDNPDIRSYLKEQLADTYAITEAVDGLDGYEKAVKESPDLVLADISMPRMDGIELCAKLKSDVRTSHVPVVLLTARTSLIYKIDGLETGADDYITKPFNMRLLATRIKNLIDSRSKLRAQFERNFALSPTEVVINSVDETFLTQVKEILEAQLENSNFSVELFADQLNMSRMQLYRKLKALTGHTPNHVIRNFRLERATQLLKHKQYNIAEITYMVGYNDLKSFREQFKKQYGVSPSGFLERT